MPAVTGSQHKYSYKQLRSLWLNAGGSRAWSYVMAAIAMAESGGVVSATHVDANNSVDYGLWQINSVHGYNPDSLTSDPAYNAHAAVSVFNSAGPHAWSTFNNGSYKKYLPGGKSAPNIADPVPGGQFGRIDQGVDYVAKSPVRALVSGVITGIVPFAQGEGVASETAIIEKFDAPVTYGGRTYYGGYYAEEKPLVKPGDRVQANQQVMAAGSDEIGFMVNQGTAFPKLRGGLGPATQPSPEGQDYAGVVAKTGGPKPPTSGWQKTVVTVGQDIANPWGALDNAITSGASAGASAAGSAISGVTGGWVAGIESLAYQGFFVIIGLGLVLVGLALVAWTVMGRVGGGNIVGMAQTQMRIRQSGARVEESQRASMVRESQAGQRIVETQRSRELSRERLGVQRQNVERRQERYVVKDKPNQVVRKKAGNPAAGVPRRDKG